MGKEEKTKGKCEEAQGGTHQKANELPEILIDTSSVDANKRFKVPIDKEPYFNICTVLFLAAQAGMVDTVKRLLKRGANSNIPSTANGDCPLHTAVSNGHIEVVEELLKNKANVNAQNKDRFTPLFIAIQDNNLKLVQILLAYGADPNIANIQKITPLQYIASYGKERIADQKLEEKLVEELINHKANCDLDGKGEGNTPLHMAIYAGNQLMTEKLIPYTNCNIANLGGYTPLHLAVLFKNDPLIKALLKKGADLKRKAENGVTPADIYHDPELIEMINSIYQPKKEEHKECGEGVLKRGSDSSGKTSNLSATDMATLVINNMDFTALGVPRNPNIIRARDLFE